MTRLSCILLATAALAALPMAQAAAADYEPPVVAAQADPYVPVEVGTGWYLRGDVGYAFSTSPGRFDFRTFDPAAGTYGAGTYATSKLKSDMTFGIGFGYTFNEWFRSDITLDGFRSNFDATTVEATPCSTDPALAGTTCRTAEAAAVRRGDVPCRKGRHR